MRNAHRQLILDRLTRDYPTAPVEEISTSLTDAEQLVADMFHDAPWSRVEAYARMHLEARYGG